MTLREDPCLARALSDGGGAIRAEALYAVPHEGARHLHDVLERRLRVSMESTDFGLGAAPEVAAVMAESPGRGDACMRDELSAHRVFVERQRAAKALRDDDSANAAIATIRRV